MISKIIETIKQGEGIKIEFKECKNKLNKDIYTTVCAFLNRNGGEIFLGVDDAGKIIGGDKDAVSQIIEDSIFRTVFTTSKGNMQSDRQIYAQIEADLSENEKMIIHFLQRNKSISTKEASKLINISPAHAKRIFSTLKEKRLIIASGSGRNLHYLLSETESQSFDNGV